MSAAGSRAEKDVNKSEPFLREPPWSSLEELTEAILRRTMRVACALGVVGIAAGFLSPRPFDAPTMALAIVVTIAIFAITFLPVRVRVLSIAYPWALLVVGVTAGASIGPGPGPFLLLAGAVFIGSLVLRTAGLLLLGATMLLCFGAAFLATSAPASAEHAGQLVEALTSMAAVIIPSAIAGRMLVGALARALQERRRLFERVAEERGALQETVDALESTRIQLTHAQKLELVGQMAGGIAHDMNNALTAVLGEASLLDDTVADGRERILEAGDHAAKLTRQLMVFGRRDVSRPRPIHLGSTLRGFLESVRRLVPSDIQLTFDLDGDDVVVVADPTQLLQVVLNLAGNAKDAMHQGGSFAIQMRSDANARQAVVEFRDTGIGIETEMLSKVFDPFFTTKPAGEGTGLGLASVKQLLEAMGAAIRVTSVVGSGTTFELRFPTTEEQVVVEERRHSAPAAQTGTVLIVDDDIRVRAVAYTCLERAGYRVLEAATVSGAVELVRAAGKSVDLLLTDVVMAGGGGAEVIRAVRREFPRVRVLVMSGYADDETLHRGVSHGAYPFLAKPFTASALVTAVASALLRERESAPGVPEADFPEAD